MQKIWTRLLWLTLGFTLLVILAGSVVRATGSGMGCPDWPRCFGYYIPPTTESQVLFQAEHSYKKKQMILWQGAFYKANKDFVSGQTFENSDWNKFTEHNYAIFNPTHTWIEYINRLSGALLGVVALFFLVFSYKKGKGIFALALGTFISILFAAWLGAKVVSSHLAPAKITVHMLVALVILFLLGLAYVKDQQKTKIDFFVLGMLLLLSIEIILGTQIREVSDTVLRQNVARSTLSEHFGLGFYVHQVLAFLLVLGVAKHLRQLQSTALILLYLLVLVVIGMSGMMLGYGGFPAVFQPMHLSSSLMLFTLFSFQFKK